MEQKQNKGKLNIELGDEIAEGIYANLAIITHSRSEFVVDFIKMLPGLPKAKVKSRIILTPQHAKRLAKALQENIKKFESLHGSIKESEMDNIPFNLGGPTAQA
jgi:predicted transcriptional regulator